MLRWLALALCLAAPVRCADLEVEYHHGWGGDASLEINFTTGEMVYQSLPDGPRRQAKLTNHEQVGRYVKHLLENLTWRQPPESGFIDVPHWNFTYKDGDQTVEREFIPLGAGLPASLHLNEGALAQGAQAEFELRRKYLEGHELVDFITALLENSFGEQPPARPAPGTKTGPRG